MNRKGLFAIALGAFALGMTEFVMMGMLPDIAGSLGISIPRAGNLISVYALGVVIGAPTLTIALQNRPPREALIILACWVMAANTLSAFALGYKTLLLLRFLAGIPHGAFFGFGAVVAGRMAEKGKTAQAIAFVFTGLTIASILGVPAGTFIGHVFLWRFTFGIVGVMGLCTAIAIRYLLPHFAAQATGDIKKDLGVFKQWEFLFILLIAVIGTGGFFAWYSYIAPLFTVIGHFSPSSVSWLMVVAGIGMTAGNTLGGKLADKYTPLTAATLMLVSMSGLLLLLSFVASSQPMAVIMTFAIGAAAFALVTPVQMLMMQATRQTEMLGSSISPAAMNIGNAMGAYFAGIPLTLGYSYITPEWVGAGMAFIGFIIALFLARYRRSRFIPLSSS